MKKYAGGSDFIGYMIIITLQLFTLLLLLLLLLFLLLLLSLLLHHFMGYLQPGRGPTVAASRQAWPRASGGRPISGKLSDVPGIFSEDTVPIALFHRITFSCPPPTGMAARFRAL